MVSENKIQDREVKKVTGTRHTNAGEKFPDLHLVVPIVDVLSDDDGSRTTKITLKVRIDPALGEEEHSNLIKIKMGMLEDLQGQSAWYLHTCYLLNKLMLLTKQGIMDEKDGRA
jgi:hypothetical protein